MLARGKASLIFRAVPDEDSRLSAAQLFFETETANATPMNFIRPQLFQSQWKHSEFTIEASGRTNLGLKEDIMSHYVSLFVKQAPYLC